MKEDVYSRCVLIRERISYDYISTETFSASDFLDSLSAIKKSYAHISLRGLEELLPLEAPILL